MKCKNCGASYKSRELKCPYCGTENAIGRIWKIERSEAEKEYEKSSIDVGVKFSPYILDRIFTRAIIIFVLLIVMIFVGAFIYFYAREKIVDYSNEKNKASIRQTLQEYYDKQEYAKMYDYMNDKEIDGSDYYEYMQAALINIDYERYLCHFASYLDLSEEKKLEDNYNLEGAIRYSVKVYTLDYSLYSELSPVNKDLYERLKKEIYAFWVGTLKMTEDDIKYVTDEYASFYNEEFDNMVLRFKVNVGEVYGG